MPLVMPGRQRSGPRCCDRFASEEDDQGKGGRQEEGCFQQDQGCCRPRQRFHCLQNLAAAAL